MTARCLDDGVLVSLDFPVPDDPREHYRVRDEVVGCNRLRCAACGAEVRRLDGWALDRPPSDAEIVALHDAATGGVASHPALTKQYQGHRARVYVCRCAAESVGGLVRLSMGDRATDWSCVGHPPP